MPSNAPIVAGESDTSVTQGPHGVPANHAETHRPYDAVLPPIQRHAARSQRGSIRTPHGPDRNPSARRIFPAQGRPRRRATLSAPGVAGLPPRRAAPLAPGFAGLAPGIAGLPLPGFAGLLRRRAFLCETGFCGTMTALQGCLRAPRRACAQVRARQPRQHIRAIGAAGAQVPYKHKVGGSNPSSPTTNFRPPAPLGGLSLSGGAARAWRCASA